MNQSIVSLRTPWAAGHLAPPLVSWKGSWAGDEHPRDHLAPIFVVWSPSRVWLFATPWTAAHQASVPHRLSEFALVHVHWISDNIQPSHPLSPPSSSSSPVFNLSQHQGLFQWLGSLHQVAKVLELQFQHQSFQWIFRVDFL